MRYRLLTFCLVAALLEVVACKKQPNSMSTNTAVLKIAVLADGRVTVDGSPATMDSVRASLKRLREQNGVVWYYREASNKQPSPQATEIIQVVIDNRLPIKLSSRPDYSDAIGMDGKPITK
jgi:hypothetical protein